MSAGHNDPRLLYSVGNIQAYHLQNGEESPLSSSGPQTMSLLMVPTSSPFDGLSSTDPQSAAPEEDFYLHLHIPPELDLPLPATTQVYHQPPRSYLIPRWDLGPDSGAFTRIEFPIIGSGPGKVSQEDIDTFETILAQCTAFHERATPPTGKGQYNPADFALGEGYVGSGAEKPNKGHIVLIDEEDGSVVGELSEGFNIVEGSDVRAGSKRPVEIQMPQEGQGDYITINNASEEYLEMSRHPAYKDSSLVQNAAVASRLIVTTSGYISNVIASGADTFTQKTKPNPKPMTFTPATKERVRKLNSLTQGAVGLSARTVGQVSRYAQNLGATMTRRGEQQKKNKGFNKDGTPIENYKPGLLNKSMMAFSTIADGIDQASRDLLNSGSTAATTVVSHRYGQDAGQVAANLAGGVRNVGLVYVDAAGVSRKGVIKSVSKGMVVGSIGKGNVMVGGGDGGQIPPESFPQDKKTPGLVENTKLPGGQQPQVGQVGFGNAAPPPSYDSGLGEPLGSQGPDPYGKF